MKLSITLAICFFIGMVSAASNAYDAKKAEKELSIMISACLNGQQLLVDDEIFTCKKEKK